MEENKVLFAILWFIAGMAYATSEITWAGIWRFIQALGYTALYLFIIPVAIFVIVMFAYVKIDDYLIKLKQKNEKTNESQDLEN